MAHEISFIIHYVDLFTLVARKWVVSKLELHRLKIIMQFVDRDGCRVTFWRIIKSFGITAVMQLFALAIELFLELSNLHTGW